MIPIPRSLCGLLVPVGRYGVVHSIENFVATPFRLRYDLAQSHKGDLTMRLALYSLVVLFATNIGYTAEKSATPFNGKDTTGWKLKGAADRSQWKIGKAVIDPTNDKKLTLTPMSEGGELVNVAGGVDIYTEEKWGDVTVELEFMVPKGSNSGIYMMGEYEVQILDSFGKDKIGPGDVGGLYGSAAPKSNASKAPGEWQKFVIVFEAPTFEGAKKLKNAKFVKVELNGTVIHENVEVKGPTPSCLTGTESKTGPLLFQGDHGPIAFRNIKVTPTK